MNQQDKELVLRIAEDLRIRHLIDDEPIYEFAHRYHLAKLAEVAPPRHEILEAQAVAELERRQTRRETKWARLEFNAQLQNKLTTANTIIEQAREALVVANRQVVDDFIAAGIGQLLTSIEEYQKGRQTP